MGGGSPHRPRYLKDRHHLPAVALITVVFRVYLHHMGCTTTADARLHLSTARSSERRYFNFIGAVSMVLLAGLKPET